jgi:hypothetical protein
VPYRAILTTDVTKFLRTTLALITGISFAGPALADADCGTFGAWKVYGDVSDRGPECHIIPSNQQTSIPAAFFLLGRAWPGSVLMAIVPLDGSLELKDGQYVRAFSTYDTGERENANFTIIWRGRGMMNVAPFSDLVRMASLHLKSWRVDLPSADINNLMIPLEGFEAAVDAFGRCGAAIGVP